MAAEGGRPGGRLTPAGRLHAEPFAFDFFQAVRLLERTHRARKPIGRDHSPAEEVARFRAHLSLAFPPSSIMELAPPTADRPAPLMTVTFLGLYGPSGVLPTHYTQLLLDLVRDVRGDERRSLRDWLDIFDHRFISLFYRAWEKYRFPIAYERGEAFAATPDVFTGAAFSLAGLGGAGHRDRLRIRVPVPATGFDAPTDRTLACVDDLAVLFYAGFFAQRPRNATNLRLMLADYFRVPVNVNQFQGRWLAIDPSGQTRLGGFGTLGENAVAGDRVWEVQSAFRLRVGPLDYPTFESFLPDKAAVPERKAIFLFMQLARLFAGPEYDFDVQLVLAAKAVPETLLGEQPGFGPRLGWNSWLVSDTPPADVDDPVFESEWVTELHT